ncbi:MAG TPA: ABC transporter permease [Gammaproteobacteria bacterium]|nr:ABC transporter permease [Gammaproteobacteria bacterium]
MNAKVLLRGLRRSPRLSLAVMFCIALGMAATATVATLIDLTAFREPPFPQADRLVRIWNAEQGGPQREGLSYRDFADLRERLTALDALEGAARARLVWHRADQPGRRVEGEAVTAGYFDLLDVAPYIGRMMTPDEQARGDDVILLSYDTWGREFSYDDGVLGRPLRVSYQNQGEDAVYTVIGVLPPDFFGTTENDMPDLEFWIPLRNYLLDDQLEARSVRAMVAVGRLTPDATVAQAQQQADALNAALAGEYDAFANGHTFNVEAFGANWREPFRDAGAAFAVAALLLLAIAVVNVALLLLAQTLERRHELAVRAALGAGRIQLVGQVLLETLLLVVCGGIIGMLFAAPLLHFFLQLGDVNVPEYLDPKPGAAALALSFAVLLIAGCAAAFLPAWHATRVDAAESLREGNARFAGSARASRRGARLVAFELALTLVLICSAALLGRSYLQLGSTELGFATEDRLRIGLFINTADVADDAALPAFYARLEEQLRAQPGVRDVALVWPTLPILAPIIGRLEHAAIQSVEPEGLRVSNYAVGDRFFTALDMPLLAGRAFDAAQSRDETPSAVLSESLAGLLGGPQRAINQIVRLNGAEFRIIGVTGDAKIGGPLEDELHRHEMYLSLRQVPQRIVSPIVHVDGDPADFAEPLKLSLARLAPASAVDWVDPLDTFIAWLYRDSAFRLAVIAAFSSSALLLALVGLYAVLSQQVVRATGEIGIRKSLGATSGRIQRDVILRGLRTVVTGLLGGAVASLAFAQVLGSMLHGVGVYDPLAFAVAGAVLLLTGLAACWLPARRAARVEPSEALRHD